MSQRPPLDQSPYPGLRPFRRGEEHLFFGRERGIDQMVETLSETHFLAVLGASGSGKSSLVQCGLLPALRRGLMRSGGSRWIVVRFRPGGRPVRAMAQELASELDLFSGLAAEGFDPVSAVEANLTLSKRGLWETLEGGRIEAGTNVLLFVDQFEELFRYQSASADGGDRQLTREDAAAFIKLLLEIPARQEHRYYVTLTMRSDFLGDCARFQGLPHAVTRGQYVVERMTRQERREAIVRPALIGGAEEVSPVLLTRLVNDVGDDLDQLSVLQHALNRTWVEWGKTGGSGMLLSEHYEAAGTMARALHNHAEQAYEALASPERKALCKRIFQALTDKADVPQGVRRPTQLKSLCEIVGAPEAEVRAVLDVFRTRDRPFLTPSLPDDPGQPDPLVGDTFVDISHESLMRVWTRLAEWAEGEARHAKLYRDLSRDAALADRGERSLWRAPELDRGLIWEKEQRPTKSWAERYAPGFEPAMRFLRKSRRRRTTWRGGAVAAVVLAAGWASTWGVLQARQAFNEVENDRDSLELSIAALERDIPLLGQRVQDLLLANRNLRWDVLKLIEGSALLEAEIPRREDENRALGERTDELVEDSLDAVTRRDSLSREIASLPGEEQRLEARRDQLEAETTLLESENNEHRKTLMDLGFLAVTAVVVWDNNGDGGREYERKPALSSGLVTGVYDSSRVDVQALQDSLDALRTEVAQLKMAAGALEVENDKLQEELATERSRNDALQARVDALEQERVRLGRSVADLERRLDELGGDITRLETVLGDGIRNLGRLRGEIAVLVARVGVLRGLNAQLARMVESISISR